ncbi:hypothetical protein EFM12_09195 [Latilactobacillus curvatus]|nr:hypothetical protein [Latilactobacillus curvatus]
MYGNLKSAQAVGYLLRISLIRQITDKVGDLTDVANRKKMAAKARLECVINGLLLSICLVL